MTLSCCRQVIVIVASILLFRCDDFGERQGNGAEYPSSEVSTVHHLTSKSARERANALSSLQHRVNVSDAELRALVDSFRYEKVIYLPGPPATATSASKLLVKHAPRSTQYLIEGLSAADSNVRRHAAFTLSEIRARSAISPIRKALGAELDRANAALPSAEDPRITLAPFRSMLDAYARIDWHDAVSWTAEQLRGAPSDVVADVLMMSLIHLAPAGPPCRDRSPTSCASEWERWIREWYHRKML